MPAATYKVVKVRIRKGGVGENMMVYPARYDALEVDTKGIGPLNVAQYHAYSGHIGLGGNEEWCLIVLPSALADEYALDPDMEIVSVHQANALMEKWRIMRGDPEIVISNPERLQNIQLKKQLGLPLSDEDQKALDPDDPTPGVNRAFYPIQVLVSKIGGTIE